MLENKKKQAILILGAGLMQKPAIESAKNLGYIVAVADGNKNAVCSSLADIFEPIDLKDKDGLLEYAKKIQNKTGLVGVFTAGTDFSASVSYITEKLSLPGHSYKAACNASDKVLMRRCFEAKNVPSPKFIEIDKTFIFDEKIKQLICKELKYPLVVKPVDNMGARGCRMVRDETELTKAIDISLKYSKTTRAIIEEYMEGPEFSIDALIFNGEMTVTGFADRHIYYPPYFIEMGHTMPTMISLKDKEALVETFFKGVKALGLTNGVAKADIKLTSKGPMIGEIAARLSGGYMSGWTYPYASEINLTEQALLISVGKIPNLVLEKRIKTGIQGIWDLPCTKISAERAWISIPGKISNIFCFYDETISGIKNIFPRVKVGDDVVFPMNNVEKCGNVITSGCDRKQTIELAENIVRNTVIRLNPINDITKEFLEQPLNTEFPPSAYILPEKEIEELFIEIKGKKTKFFNEVPKNILPYLTSLKDWNGRTIKETLEILEKIVKEQKCIDSEIFWKSLLRGGIQGILFVLDSIGN